MVVINGFRGRTRAFVVVVVLCAWPGCTSRGTDVSSDVLSPVVDVAADRAVGEAVKVVEVLEEMPVSPVNFTVMTFNTGTTNNILHGRDEEAGEGDGYTDAHAAENAAKYSNNLAWNPAEQALAQFIAERKPAIVAFQELYYDPWCADIEVDPQFDFVCNEYEADGPLQIERLLGDDYSVACAGGHPDNCVGVLKQFGFLPECGGAGPCLEGLAGMAPPSGCTSGARVGTALVELNDGRQLAVVNAHTVAGMTTENMACRKEHFQQIFEDRGDGNPAAFGPANLIMGDMNTDPFLLAGADPSATYLASKVGPGKAFHFVSSDSQVGPDTHATPMKLDHVISDALVGSCVVAGVSEGTALPMETSYWDHRPVVCEVEW
jgi:hypothetical protein